MAKKKKVKTVQMLSPEKYIRQKAHTLPIYECMINADWAESQMANLIVARKHTNGNITAGLYLVDLLCLGVKDSHYFFNIPEFEYNDRLEHFFNMESGIKGIEYNLAHNIVYSGIEFADDYEFKPHKDFELVSQYILEEDNEDIPLIEIACGIDGLPAYMQGPLHSNKQADRVISQLERVAGKGNYYLLDEEGRIVNEDEVYENEDSFMDISSDEKEALFKDYFLRLNDLNKDETDYLFELSNSIIEDLSYNEEFDKFYAEFNKELSKIQVDHSVIPDEMLGVDSNTMPLSYEVKQQFMKILHLGDSKKYKSELAKFRKNKGVDAAFAYLDLILTEKENVEAYEDKLRNLAKKYPNYGLIQMRYAEIDVEDSLNFMDYDYFFKGRICIHGFEYFNFIHLRAICIAVENNINKLEAWKNAIVGYVDNEMEFALLFGKIQMLQILVLAKIFGLDNE